MSPSDIAVSIKGLSKSYTIAHNLEKHNTLAETLLSRLKNPLRRPTTETFWALKDVSFDIRKGEVVGIIGRNGAGKSTLLKLLSRITEPTDGQIELFGRVGSLLEVGTGFHQELTGRENVYLNGAILGMTKAEIRRQFDAIVDFAGVEKFLDTPVKRYSSGMYVRLAFAVAAHLNSDILVVDEVLAVGDADFQKKCLGKMKDISTRGEKTVLFVSHNIGAISALCTSCALLASGKLLLAADTKSVVSRYLNEADTVGRVTFDVSKNPRKPVVFQSCSVINQAGELTGSVGVTEPFTIRLSVLCREPIDAVELTIRIDNAEGQPIFTTNFSDVAEAAYSFTSPGEHLFDVTIPKMFLAPGRYSISMGLHRPFAETYDLLPNASNFDIEEIGSNMARYQGTNYGVVLVSIPWKPVTAQLPQVAL
jgi:lipopolysaccharide transport system ATP-binding protein